jgi:hypothetical protein
MNLETRVYQALLKLYPREFRQEYSEEMTRVFQESLRTEGSSFGFWIRVIWDVISSALSVRWDTQSGEFMRVVLVKFCAICGIVLGLATAWVGITSPLYNTPSWINNIWIACSILMFLGFVLVRPVRPHLLEIAGYIMLLGGQAITMFLPSHGPIGLLLQVGSLFVLSFGHSFNTSRRIRWQTMPLEAKILLMLAGWISCLFILIQVFPPAWSRYQSAPLEWIVLLTTFQIVYAAFIIVLSWSIWAVASQDLARPSRAQPA